MKRQAIICIGSILVFVSIYCPHLSYSKLLLNSPEINFTSISEKDGDKDKDGIPDSKDKCPDVKGKKLLMGCPDKDNDGVADDDDLCPDQKGPSQLRGCPDTDGDGVADNYDQCPNDYGYAATRGCPEREGDEALDRSEACPDEIGMSMFKGHTDTDEDGVADNLDECPNVKGSVTANGCPDADQDSIPDLVDKCPDVKGTVTNSGCPVINEEQRKFINEKIASIVSKIQFEKRTDILKSSSFSKLDTIVSLMKHNSSLDWSVVTHNNNVSKNGEAFDLPKRRAAALKSYLINKGIEEKRISDGESNLVIKSGKNKDIEIKIKD